MENHVTAFRVLEVLEVNLCFFTSARSSNATNAGRRSFHGLGHDCPKCIFSFFAFKVLSLYHGKMNLHVLASSTAFLMNEQPLTSFVCPFLSSGRGNEHGPSFITRVDRVPCLLSFLRREKTLCRKRTPVLHLR